MSEFLEKQLKITVTQGSDLSGETPPFYSGHGLTAETAKSLGQEVVPGVVVVPPQWGPQTKAALARGEELKTEWAVRDLGSDDNEDVRW